MKKKFIIVAIVSLIIISIIGVVYVQAKNAAVSVDVNNDDVTNNADVQMILNDPKLADVNGDGKIDNDDIEIIIDSLVLGDVNLDGHICAEDARLVLSYYGDTSSGKSGDFNGLQKVLANVNCDKMERDGKLIETIDASDASNILAYIADTNSGIDTKEYDTNNDGIVTMDEFLTKYLEKDEDLTTKFKKSLKEYVQNIVSEVDTNKDGILSMEEIDKYMEQFK